MKVGVIVITYNLPSEVFLLQVETFKKFCKDDYELNVFDNSDDKELAEAIRYHSSTLGIPYTKTFSGSKNSSDSHAFTANFSYNKLKEAYPFIMFADHDLLPIKPFSVVEILNETYIGAGIGQEKSRKYIWPGIFLLKVAVIDKELVDFLPSHELGLDTGGNLYKLIEAYGEKHFKFFDEEYHQNSEYNGAYNYYSLIYNRTFFHMVNGSNWNHIEGNEERLRSLVNIIKEKIAE